MKQLAHYVFFAICIIPQGFAQDLKKLTVTLQKEVMIGYDIFEKPIHIEEGRIVDSFGKEYPWASAFDNLLNFGLLDYSEWEKSVSDEYKEHHHINEARFSKMKDDFDQVRKMLGTQSILASVRLHVDDRELIYIFTYIGKHLDDYPRDLTKMDIGVSTFMFELIGGHWKNQHLELGSWETLLANPNLDVLEAFVESGSVLIDKYRNVIPEKN